MGEVRHHIEPVYVTGGHEGFVEAFADKIKHISAGGTLEILSISHTLAFDPEGVSHWSAIFEARVTFEDDD